MKSKCFSFKTIYAPCVAKNAKRDQLHTIKKLNFLVDLNLSSKILTTRHNNWYSNINHLALRLYCIFSVEHIVIRRLLNYVSIKIILDFVKYLVIFDIKLKITTVSFFQSSPDYFM